MLLNLQLPRESLNKAYLKTRPNRSQIETFKKKILNLIDNINNQEGEEHNKNIVSEFLKNTWYSPNHYINTKERADLVIHTGKDAASPVGVLFEVKKPENRHEMPSKSDLNSKAFNELVLYYLRERIRDGNVKIKHLIITNIYEWFIFESADFERLFANNKKLVEDFKEFEEKRSLDTVTDFFYKSIAGPFIKNLDSQITFTHFDIRDYEKVVRNADTKDDKNLIVLYKIFSPEHLLKLPFTNDSNTLDKSFYSELLHIVGLEESKSGSKKIIGRKPEERRNPGSLLENTLNILISEDCLSLLNKRSDFGSTTDEQFYNVALELVITWINRILFLKLLEGQIKRYNGGDKNFSFLNSSVIEDFDELNKLFFRVLAVKEEDRSEDINKKYAGVPFLNSSLFEPTVIEHRTIRINSLEDNITIPLLTSTVLKDSSGKKITGSLKPLEYLFQFLDSYDFSSEGSEDIQEENKTLINASVLGLIFEKINGYKDGSFFTPGFITMYMCHETITRAVVQKFNEAKGWSCETITDIYNKNPEIAEANRIVNSLKICDPAVGSGHFLVSALNEIIAIKSELGILADRNGKLLRDYTIEVINDELVITDSEGRFFEYNPKNKESQRVQETLFREKQTIIENCLFGVDINPNSVKICRLRLWIELLKNSYYKVGKDTNAGQTRNTKLETLPNIDINIKCGNSLISRYPLDADISVALRASKWTIDNYREAVMTYRNAKSKDEKRAMEELIAKIKTDFEVEVSHGDKRYLKLNKLKGELMSLSGQTTMFELTKQEKAEWNKKVGRLTTDIKKIEDELNEIKSNKIYENAFEWRFEFPEVLNNQGDFNGFDVVIGNPPYIRQEAIKEYKGYLGEFYRTFSSASDIYVFFVEKSFEILNKGGVFSFIFPNKWMQAEYGIPLRNLFLTKHIQSIIDFGDLQIFEEATTYPCILVCTQDESQTDSLTLKISSLNQAENLYNQLRENGVYINLKGVGNKTWMIQASNETEIITKLRNTCQPLSAFINGYSYRGILTGLTEAFVINEDTREKLMKEDVRSSELLKPFLLGRNIKPYNSGEVNNWLIFIPKGFTKNLVYKVNESEDINSAWKTFSGNFPAIATHLAVYSDRAKARADQGDYWWELRACDYYSIFTRSKIMYQVLQVKPCFIFDNLGLY
ncbi:MAG TPA: Eco57I restriction-modification methylase domain-containing protein, partial [Bacteroidales bacterium]|nr:Eco57I restriction-modification methylase domain-containing protein [Bacteroidales bacterium]